ncbi:MAG: hypothetical protein CBE00_03235 [Planctomycetaceae bacterium TMED240]|nr:hypothetical protein [Rhodopirellula sp.]OUX07906.1 MAG: hypothetical protein CBE00_03235 [Planctomycetaceae bacterium TMED240]
MTQQDDFGSAIEAQLVVPSSAGAPMDASTLSDRQGSFGKAPAGYGGADKLIQSKLAVLACLFLVTGFLGLPLLWMNRRFSAAERFLWAFAVTIYTLVLIGLVGAIVIWCYKQLMG